MSAKDQNPGSISPEAELISDLERQIEQQRLKIERLLDDNKKLTKQVIKERRLRYAAKNLVVGVDKAVQAQIERLNTTSAAKRKAHYQLFDTSDTEADRLLQVIEMADIRANYSTRPTHKRTGRKLAYKTLKTTYFIPRHLVALTLRSAIKVIVRKPDSKKNEDEED